MMGHGLHRNPFRFLITPTAVNADLFYDLSLAPASFWDHVRSDGGDIRVTKQDGITPVPIEIVGLNSTTKVGQLYFGTSSGTAFYVYYGNRQFVAPSASATFGAYNVWESSAALVMHGDNIADSTVNQNAASSPNPPSIVAGKVGSAMSFNGSTNVVNLGNGASLRVTGDITIMAWVNVTNYSALRCLISKSNSGGFPAPYDVYMTTGAGPYMSRGNGTLYASSNGTSSPAAGQWRHIAVTMAGTTVQYYVQGGTNGSSQPLSTTIGDTGENCAVGIRKDGATKMLGLIDELRLYNRALTATEIARHYANQNSPGTFWTTGTQELV